MKQTHIPSVVSVFQEIKTQRYPSAIIGDHLFMTVYGKVSFFNNKALSKGRGYVIVCETVSFNKCLSHSS